MGNPKIEKGPHGDPGPQMGTHLGAVHWRYDIWLTSTPFAEGFQKKHFDTLPNFDLRASIISKKNRSYDKYIFFLFVDLNTVIMKGHYYN